MSSLKIFDWIENKKKIYYGIEMWNWKLFIKLKLYFYHGAQPSDFQAFWGIYIICKNVLQMASNEIFFTDYELPGCKN